MKSILTAFTIGLSGLSLGGCAVDTLVDGSPQGDASANSSLGGAGQPGTQTPTTPETEALEAAVLESSSIEGGEGVETTEGTPELGVPDDSAPLAGVPAAPHTDGETRQTGQAQNSEGFRVLTLNIRYDELEDAPSLLQRWSQRRARVKKVIRDYNPDIIALQEVEEDTWSDISADFSDYHRWYQPRGGLVNPDEGVALLVRASRFDAPTEWAEKTFTPDDELTRCLATDWISRNIIRLKVRDKTTDRTLDLFSTHFPTGKDCYKKGMAKMVANWVEDYGENILLMGDFNTGWSSSGSMHEPFSYLYDQCSVDLDDAIRTDYGRSFRSTDSIITTQADEPWKRFGSMIDHIMLGPAFVLEDAKIDRSLFSGSARVWCDGSTNMRLNNDGTRDECKVSSNWVPVEDLDVYSDHWAVYADMYRIDCSDGC